MSSTTLESRLLSENINRKNFVDNARLDIVNGREISREDIKEAIKYLQEDSVARGEKQAKAKAPVKKAAAKPSAPVDADALLKGMF